MKRSAPDADTAEESTKPRSKTKKTKVAESEGSPRAPIKKPTKYNTKSKSAEPETSSDSDKFIDLGKNKRATVRSFKKTTLIDIREYYEDKASGELKPGKKGISLTVEQWEELKAAQETVDELIAELKE